MAVKELKAKAFKVLGGEIDQLAGASGFTRTPKGLVYRCTRPSLLQKVNVSLQRPNSHSGNRALIQAYVWCESEEVGRHALQLVRGRKDTLYAAPEHLFNIPAGLWQQTPQTLIWEPYDDPSWEAFGDELAALLRQVVFPAFDEFSSLPALAEGYRGEDSRLLVLNPRPVQIAATFIAIGDTEGARAYLSRRLAFPQLLKRERKLIERVLPRI